MSTVNDEGLHDHLLSKQPVVEHKDGQPVVSVVTTQPTSVLEDISKAMDLAGIQQNFSPDISTLLKINISWQHWYPGCSTSPWQLDGVIQALKNLGHHNIIGAHNGTVVVDSFEGERNNKHKEVQDKHYLPVIHLDSLPNKWVDYLPKSEMIVLHDIRLWTHSVIHETLVDLLAIQKEIHPAIFAVMDGTFAGDGPGPRAMRWHIKNKILASSDQVAIDAVAAHMMGFNPMDIKFIRLAHERGLGCGDISKIQVMGEDISRTNWAFSWTENTFASRGQKLIY